MDTKWRISRTRRGVRWICLTLSLLLTAGAACAALNFGLWWMDMEDQEGYMTDSFGASTEQYFNDKFNTAYYNIISMMRYPDRARVSAGEYLKWETDTIRDNEVTEAVQPMELVYHLISTLPTETASLEYDTILFAPDMSAEQLEFNMDRALSNAVNEQMVRERDSYEALTEGERQRFLKGGYLQWHPAWHSEGSFVGYDAGEPQIGSSAVLTPPPEEQVPMELRYNLISELDGAIYATVPFLKNMDSVELEAIMERELTDAIWKQRNNNAEDYNALTEEEQQQFRDGMYFRWEPEWHRSDNADPASDNVRYGYSLLRTDKYGASDNYGYARIESPVPLAEDDPQRLEAAKNAIRLQLAEFDAIERQFREMPALHWYASETALDGETYEYGDKELTQKIAQSQYTTYARWENQSYSDGKMMGKKNLRWDKHMYFTSDILGQSVLVLAFDSDYVETVHMTRKVVQEHIIGYAVQIAALLLLALALFCVAASVKHRARPDGSAERDVPRRIWLDVLLLLMLIPLLPVFTDMPWVGSVLEDSVRYFVSSDQSSAMYFVTALLTVFLALPVSLWLLALIRRIKAGAWWRHTLVYTLLRGLWRGIKALFGALPLVLQGGAVIVALVIQVLVLLAMDSGGEELGILLGFIFVGIDIAFVAMVLTQLRAVERGAAAAARGEEPSIPAMLGVFRRIGDSVNGLSGNINSAVEERMKSERMKTELITNVSHDIRTPLTGLIAYVDLLKTDGLDSEKAPEYVEILAQKAQRLKTLTEDLFEASKAASGNIKADLETLDFCALTRQVLGEMDERIAQSGLDFRVTLPERAVVRADGRMLWRVVENLLDNALKYSMPGSRVYLSLEEHRQEAQMWLKNVSALPLGDVSGLTERFTRGDESRATEGSGLGLSIVQSFLEAQGGRFALEADGDLFKACATLPVDVMG